MGQLRTIIDLFCKRGPAINKKRALHRAVTEGNVSDVELILSDSNKFALPFWCRNLPDDLGKMLHCTTNVEIGRWLLSYGAKVDVRNRRNETPLMTAVRRSGDTLDYVVLLLDHGADVYAWNDSNQTPLLCSVSNGNYNAGVVQALLSRGSNANWCGRDGYTALMTVACHRESQRKNFKKEKVLRGLSLKVSRGSKRCSRAVDAATDGAFGGQVDVAKELLDNGASVNIYHNQQGTALHMSLRNPEPNPEIIDLLLDRCVNLRSASNVFQDTPLHAAAGNIHVPAHVVHKLIRMGADVDVRNIEGNTPLHIAAEKDRVEIVKALLDAGAYVSALNKYRNTPLHLAARHSSHAVRELIKDPSLLVNAKNQDRDTPLMILAQESNCDASTVRLLVRAGANVTETNSFQETALHKAMKNGDWNLETFHCPKEMTRSERLEAMAEYFDASTEKIDDAFALYRHYELRLKTIKELVKCGSNIFATDLNGKTPLMIGCSMDRSCGRMVIKYSMLHYFYGKLGDGEGAEACRYLDCRAEMPEFSDACMGEVLRMRKDDITDNISVYDYLNKEKLTLDKMFIINQNIYGFSEAIFQKVLSREYPVYNDALCESLDPLYLEEKFVESNLYVNAEDARGREIVLDSYSMRAVAEFVPRPDLAKFILAFADVNFLIEEPFDVLPTKHFTIPVTCCAKHKLSYTEKS